MRKAVVTGGAGFIGSHIAEELIERGYHVLVIDDLSTGNLQNINHLIETRKLEFIHGSINDLPLLRLICTDAQFIFHEAAIASVQGSIDNPLHIHEVNVNGTLNVLVAARDAGVTKVVYASSSSIYGDTPTPSNREEMIPVPQSPYAVSKLAAEYYCRVFDQVYNLPTACLRYFNVYGPRQSPDSQYAAVIPKFIKRIKESMPPIIFGNGEQTRDFIFVKEVALANIMSAESNATGVFNIGSGECISINALSQLLLALMKRPDITPVFETAKTGDIKHSMANITKAKSFGYTPSYDLEHGLKETIYSLAP
jgi:nucleoside-diphosphate-sugar epimerase